MPADAQRPVNPRGEMAGKSPVGVVAKPDSFRAMSSTKAFPQSPATSVTQRQP
jgi:hypothetical protein